MGETTRPWAHSPRVLLFTNITYIIGPTTMLMPLAGAWTRSNVVLAMSVPLWAVIVRVHGPWTVWTWRVVGLALGVKRTEALDGLIMCDHVTGPGN